VSLQQRKEHTVEYRTLGKTGMVVSALCLGAMTFGRESDEPTSYAVLDRFVAAGGTFIDTANVYGRGTSEEILGRWLKGKPRDSLVIATKVRFPMSDDSNDVGLSRKHIMASAEASLRRLGTEYIDLYQIHRWDELTPLEETLRALDDLVRAGKVRYLGASNVAGWQLQKAVDMSRAAGWERFVCLQPLYNLLDRSTEWELIPVCLSEGIGVIPWSPLRGGWLSGKYRRGMQGPPAGTRVADATAQGWSESWEAYDNEHTWRVLDELHAVAEQSGRHPVQVALNWLLRQPGVTAPIIGARSVEQLEGSLGAVGWELDTGHLARLTRASEPERLPYPYDTMARSPRRV
jgi:aryl-alcohol dehydrogenase-like predicted oxidoreductase